MTPLYAYLAQARHDELLREAQRARRRRALRRTRRRSRRFRRLPFVS
jgi:hypothetical protein